MSAQRVDAVLRLVVLERPRGGGKGPVEGRRERMGMGMGMGKEES